MTASRYNSAPTHVTDVIQTGVAVRVALATTLLVAGGLLVRLAGSITAGTVLAETTNGRPGLDLGRLPFSPFAEHGTLIRPDDDRPGGRTAVGYWLLGGAMVVAGAGLVVGSLL